MDRKDIIDIIIKSQDLANAEKSEVLHVRRIATWNSPQIEYAFQNTDSMSTIAFCFPDINKSQEQWIKESLDSLSNFDSCITCIPSTQLENAYYLCDIIKEKGLDELQIGIVVYDYSGNIRIVKMYRISNTSTLKRSSTEQKSYWCWWRDASHYEVALLLELSEKYNGEQEDIYTKFVYPEFYDMLINQKTKQWDGTPRKKKHSESSYKAEKQNYKIPMCQLGLWEAKTGHITSKGKLLLEVVHTKGVESDLYFRLLSKLVLLDGKHLDLIKDLDDFQKYCPELIPETSADFFVLFDRYMEEKNSLGTRKPTAVTTGAKNAYVRDEPKLWNKLGIIVPSGKSRYYEAFKGIKFNWNRINEILLTTYHGVMEGNNEKI